MNTKQTITFVLFSLAFGFIGFVIRTFATDNFWRIFKHVGLFLLCIGLAFYLTEYVTKQSKNL